MVFFGFFMEKSGKLSLNYPFSPSYLEHCKIGYKTFLSPPSFFLSIFFAQYVRISSPLKNNLFTHP